MIFKIKSDYYPKQHVPIVLCSGHEFCSIWERSYSFCQIVE